MPIIDRQEIHSFSNLELLAKQVVEGFITGLHKSPFHGFSVEFAEHRIYNTGESTRHIDWKLFARTDRLFIKRYEEETNLRCQLVIDSSLSMYFPFEEKADVTDTKIGFSVYAAAAMAELLKHQRDAIGLTVFNTDIVKHLPAKGSPLHQKLVFRELESLLEQPRPEENRMTTAAKALHQVAEVTHKRSLIVIFSDMFDSDANNEELFAALQHLKYKKHEVVLFHVTDKQRELSFDYDNRPYRFIDLETKEEIKLNPHQVRERYLEQINGYLHELRLKCGQYHIDFVEADTKEGFQHVLYTYLVKRSLMLK